MLFVRVLCIFMVLYSMEVLARAETEPVVNEISLLNMTAFTKSDNEYFRKLFLEFKGHNFVTGMTVKSTPNPQKKGTECVSRTESGAELPTFSLVWQNSTVAHVTAIIPAENKSTLYLCVKAIHVVALDSANVQFGGEVIKWVHQGEDVVLRTDSHPDEDPLSRKRRNPLSDDPERHTTTDCQPGPMIMRPEVNGLRVETADRDPTYDDDGVPILLAHSRVVLRIFGTGFDNYTLITVTQNPDARGQPCEFPVADEFPVEANSISNFSALVRFRVPGVTSPGASYYLCVKNGQDQNLRYLHQGTESWLTLRSYEKLLPLWMSIGIIILCLTFSALFSGLNLGLMSMDQTELKIVANTGTEAEKHYARAIMPVRKTGNYLLCSILLGNVLVNSTLTIMMDDLTSGLVAIIGSTLTIVIFGEICPQAICSRYGLAVGAKTIYITRVVMIITFPLSYPISKLLDRILGVELGNVYNRERLKELVKLTTDDLERDEVNIISGALELKKKIVSDVMTRLEDVFMLSYDAILDFETVSEIMKQGYSRIPVYEGSHSNIVTVLYIKDLAFVDPDDNTPLQTLCKFYQNPCNFVFEDTTLDVMFRQFKEGIKGHMAFVHRVNSEGEGDPFYETIGLVTLEDVIEELIQSEIVDETDVWTDNRSKRRRNEKMTKQDFTIFAERRENQHIHISPQLTLATFQYLSTAVDAFKPDVISETILRRLLKQDVIYHIKAKNRDKARSDPQTVIYLQGKAVDYFVLILEGRVEVVVGKENMIFESGPFTYFGTQALIQNVGVDSPTSPTPQNLGSLQSVNLDAMLRHTFIPDYTVRAITEVFYVRIKRSLYLAAKRATLMERAKKDTQSEDHFDDEVEKLLHSLDEDDRSQGPVDSPTLSRAVKDVSHHISQSDEETLQHCVMAAERSMLGLGNDINVLQSLSTSSGSMRGAHSPLGRASSPAAEPNISLKGSGDRPQSPTKEDLPLVYGKENRVTAEERTVLLPSGDTNRC